MGKRALGKGLDALISGGVESALSSENFQYLKLEDVLPNRIQPRKVFNDEKLEELAQSIRENGLIQPVVVRRKDSKYELIVGERRLRAAKKAGLLEIPAFVKDLSEGKLLELALIENIQREDLNPVEEAMAYKLIIGRDNITQDELAKRIGKSRSYIANMIRIMELPDEIRENVSRGTLSVGQAKAILAVKNEAEQLQLARRILNEELTVRQVEGIARKKNVPRGTKVSVKDPFVSEVEDKLRERFGTKVALDYRKGRGFIRIDFFSEEELERILDEIL